jgi:hypothetical protein
MAPFTPSPHGSPRDEELRSAPAPEPARTPLWPAPARSAAPAAPPVAPPVAPPPVRGAEPPAVERRRSPRRPLGAPADKATRGRRDDVRAMPPGTAPPPPVERRRVPPRDLVAPAEPSPLDAAPFDVRPVEARPVEARQVEPRPVAARAVAARAAVASPVPPAAPPYGDWTKPSRSGPGTDTGNQVPVVDEPGTDEEVRSSRAAELFPRLQASAASLDRDDERMAAHDEDPAAMTGTLGGRAALRAQREEAEAARRKAGRTGGRKGGATAAVRDGAAPRRSPRRAATGLVAVAVVALGVLGVYSFASPNTRSTASAGAPATGSVALPAPSTTLPDLPPLNTGGVAPSVAPVPAAPAAKLPVTVLNETTVTGLAAKVSGVLKGGGWPTTDVGTYTAKDVSVTTVYFTQDDDAQRAAAVALVDQFPQLHGPVPRFFDVPGQPKPGLVVVTTGDWKP